jgi:hypothetical protein
MIRRRGAVRAFVRKVKEDSSTPASCDKKNARRGTVMWVLAGMLCHGEPCAVNTIPFCVWMSSVMESLEF